MSTLLDRANALLAARSIAALAAVVPLHAAAPADGQVAILNPTYVELRNGMYGGFYDPSSYSFTSTPSFNGIRYTGWAGEYIVPTFEEPYFEPNDFKGDSFILAISGEITGLPDGLGGFSSIPAGSILRVTYGFRAIPSAGSVTIWNAYLSSAGFEAGTGQTSFMFGAIPGSTPVPLSVTGSFDTNPADFDFNVGSFYFEMTVGWDGWQLGDSILLEFVPSLNIEVITPGPTFCTVDYNRDGFTNLDDLGDFITDFYTEPPIPGGFQLNAPTYPGVFVGFFSPCPEAPDAPAPYDAVAYRAEGYRVGFSPDGSNACPLDPSQLFPNLDNLNDFITAFYALAGTPGC
jgi:hypothetical protein